MADWQADGRKAVDDVIEKAKHKKKDKKPKRKKLSPFDVDYVPGYHDNKKYTEV